MKTINLKTNSWHYFLAVKLGSFNTESGDFCSYVRNVILGSLLGLMFLAIATLMVAVFGGAVLNVGLFFYHLFTGTAFAHNDFLTFATVFTGIVLLAIGGVAGSVFVKNKLDERKYAKAQLNLPDSFLKAAYKSFKNKVCFKVDFTDGVK